MDVGHVKSKSQVEEYEGGGGGFRNNSRRFSKKVCLELVVEVGLKSSWEQVPLGTWCQSLGPRLGKGNRVCAHLISTTSCAFAHA